MMMTVLIGLMGLAMIQSTRETLLPRLVSQQILLPNLPWHLHGYRILLISDLHSTGRGLREERLLRLAQTPADLICFTGDLIHRSPGHEESVAQLMARLTRGRKAFVVWGNNDYNPEIDRPLLRGLLKHHGLEVLENAAQPWAGFWVIGVEDPFWGHDDLPHCLPREPGFKLLLAHSPSILSQASQVGVDLLLAGHTHGGQVVIPGLTGHLRGLLSQGQTQCFVTRGVGTTRLPFRLGAPSEIAVLTLIREDGHVPSDDRASCQR